VTHLLAEIQKIVRQTFPKNIDLELDLSSDLWLIAADATMLHQVFMNLCVNARDAMPEGGQLSVSTQNLVIDENYARMNLDAMAGPYVVITISDTGMGMKPEVIDRIFDPFFTTKDVGQGTGLGLSTVLGIIKSHKGFVNVYSEVGRGSRFTVYLPATEMAETLVTVEAILPAGHGELILVVDDETAVQEITKVTLEDHGYVVMTASDGIEAIAIYAEHKSRIGLVLMDLMMPSLDAGTTIRTLHKLNGQVRIVAMSGLAANESVTKGMENHVQGFLAKPFTAPELLNMLSGILQKL
jgi:two-component system, cell cycle sensor histidine kinase and response regulator CckA